MLRHHVNKIITRPEEGETRAIGRNSTIATSMITSGPLTLNQLFVNIQKDDDILALGITTAASLYEFINANEMIDAVELNVTNRRRY